MFKIISSSCDSFFIFTNSALTFHTCRIFGTVRNYERGISSYVKMPVVVYVNCIVTSLCGDDGLSCGRELPNRGEIQRKVLGGGTVSGLYGDVIRRPKLTEEFEFYTIRIHRNSKFPPCLLFDPLLPATATSGERKVSFFEKSVLPLIPPHILIRGEKPRVHIFENKITLKKKEEN